jgi:hypothetical protein
LPAGVLRGGELWIPPAVASFDMVCVLAGACGGGTHHAPRSIEKLGAAAMTLDLPGGSRRPTGPTTLSSLAHSGPVSTAAPRSRLGLIAGASAIVLGSAIGSALALRAEPAIAPPPPRASAPAAAAPAAGASIAASPGAAPAIRPAAPAVAAPAAAPSPAAAPPAPELRAALVAQIRDTLQRFVAWSHAHPGARCPDAAALGAALDPWGQPLRIVCSDQPPDQIAGVLSYGPDGEPGTRDDVVSWALGADVTDLARGPRWSASRGMSPAGPRGPPRGGPRTASAPPPPPPRASAAAAANDTDGDGIPDRR